MKSFITKLLNKLKRRLSRKTKYKYLESRDIYVHHDSYLGNETIIGDGTNINGPAYIASSKSHPVYIGKYCAIAHNLRIRPHNHKTNYLNLQYKFQNRFQFPSLNETKGTINIGNNVWIADNVTILSGVSIGDGAVIGAGAVVTKNIPAYSIAVGVPAKVIRIRFSSHIITQLSEIAWWNWSDEKIKRNKQLFSTDLASSPNTNLYSIIVD